MSLSALIYYFLTYPLSSMHEGIKKRELKVKKRFDVIS